MRAALLLLLSACSAGELTVVLPRDMGTTIVIAGSEAWLFDHASPRPAMRFEDEGDPIAVLHWPGALLVEADGRGALIQAEKGGDPEHAWPLPRPSRGSKLANDALVDLDAGELATIAASILIPAPPCPTLEVIESIKLDDLAGASTDSLAMIGDAGILTTGLGASGRAARAIFVKDGVPRDLVLDPPLAVGTRLRAFSEGDRFVMIATSADRVTTYVVSSTGAIGRGTDEVAPMTTDLMELRRSPSAIFGMDPFSQRVFRFGGGAWAVVSQAELPPEEQRCAPYRSHQTFALDGPESGIVSYSGMGPARFPGTPAPIATDVTLGVPCQSAYFAFGSGAELVTHLVGIGDDGMLDIDSAWRSDPTSPWMETDFPATISHVTVRGDRAIGIDFYIDTVALVTWDPRRPDRRPRVCGRLGTANVDLLTFDGTGGAFRSQDNLAVPAYFVRYALRD